MTDTNKLKQDINDKFILISPDSGSLHKIYKLAEQIGYKGKIITCSKERDNKGKLTQIIVPDQDAIVDQDIVIIDDICDGGKTFINIIKYMEECDASIIKNRKYLIISHGIFSQGFLELSKYFDGIYCTNSYKDLTNKDTIIGTGISVTDKLVKQLNIF